MPKAYILMADIVGSSKKNSRSLIKEFKQVVTEVKKRNRGKFLSPITITLGDEFQAVVKSLEIAVDIILSIEEISIKQNANFKLRYVVEYGMVDTSINSQIAYEMLGPGLTKARAHLILLKKEKEKRVAFFLQNEQQSGLIENLFFVFLSIADGWKKADYYLIKAFLENQFYSRVADELKMNRSQVWKREKTLMIREYFSLKKSIQYVSSTSK